ncbi:MAG: L-glutamate gamma-semialdehyde dehydrogenase [Chitinophagales bacterium]|nr:L-glutamate gamma-semialdehyde dehydrogenase [Chitinophagales bacterium]
MPKGFFNVPIPVNEPVKSYAPGSPERAELKQMLKKLKEESVEVPLIIGGKEIRTGNKEPMRMPHDHQHILGYYHKAGKQEVQDAINAALAAKKQWVELNWYDRAAIFLKAAELLAGPRRAWLNGVTMLNQSKNAFQAEIDAACELIDFFRFNVHYMTEIYQQQPISSPGVWNRMEYRPLEGFVVAITPFNFTSIGGNLPTAPALMGNTVVWKPASTAVYSAWVIMQILKEAGLPDGVINLVASDGRTIGDTVFSHPDFTGVHFTGSTGTFNQMWKTIGENMSNYKTYPRIVGETGGKDFVVAHPSANPIALATALSRGAFEYQGQKCSAASRAYVPQSLWPEVSERLKTDLKSFRMGPVDDFRNFINAVIDEKSFDKITSYIASAKESGEEIVAGGNFDKSKGYFIEPTVIRVNNPGYVTMCEELFGPVLTVYVYEDAKFEETLDIVNTTSPYGLTGAFFAQDRYVIEKAADKLKDAAGNFYINDKPTGAVVGQQPFGGARASGTNDKAGSYLNLLRWVSARSIKETFVPPVDYRYPFMAEE